MILPVIEIPAVDPSTVSSQWPFGKPVDGTIPIWFVCDNPSHRINVMKALPFPGARYETYGAAFTGYRIKRIIYFLDGLRDVSTTERNKRREYLEHLRCKLPPGYTDNFCGI